MKVQQSSKFDSDNARKSLRIFEYGKVNPKQLNPAVYALLGLTSGISFFMLVSSLTPTLELKMLFLFPPAAMAGVLTLFYPEEGLSLWSLGLVLLITQTGFQADIRGLRLSALELTIPFLLLMVLIQQRRLLISSYATGWRMPGLRLLILFTLYAVGMLVIGILSGADLNDAMVQFKGFLFYPLMAVVFLAGIQQEGLLRWMVVIPTCWYIYSAGNGIWLFIQNSSGGQELARIGGQYSTINGYSITLTTIALLVFGYSLYSENKWGRALGIVLAIILFSGAITAVARTSWIAMGGALIFLAAVGKIKKRYIFLLFIIFACLFFLLPDVIANRIWQLSDSSTGRRLFYLQSGWRAFQARWLTGWGWGRSFFYYPAIGLRELSFPPNYHNDYLNLAVQTGLIGLSLYLAYWGRLLHTAVRWLHHHRSSPLAGYVAGSAAALVGLLIAAAFEHVLWRSDIAGLVGLFSGLLLAAINIARRQTPVAADTL